MGKWGFFLSQSPRASRTNFLACCPPSDEKRQAPSLSTRLGFPVKVSARSLVSCSMTTVVGEAVLRSVCSVVRVAYGFSSMRGAAAACVAAEAAAGVLMMVFFAQNARELAESLTPIGGVVLRVMVSSACVAYGGVTSSLECPAVCVPAETASLAEVLAFGDLFDDLGSDRSSRKLSSGRVCCPVGRVVRQVGGLRQSPRQSRGSCGTRTSGQAGDPMVPHHRFVDKYAKSLGLCAKQCGDVESTMPCFKVEFNYPNVSILRWEYELKTPYAREQCCVVKQEFGTSSAFWTTRRASSEHISQTESGRRVCFLALRRESFVRRAVLLSAALQTNP